ncbi:MAG: NUDIX domain-containing protein [Pseudomonadota bacterium]
MANGLALLIWRLRALVRPPVTLGVRCMVIDADERVLLVRHTYTAGWHLPGGGVDAHESARTAATRELKEETGVDLQTPADFFALYWNKALAGRDHVALYVARLDGRIDDGVLRTPAAEIADAMLCPLTDLPDDAAPSVRRRVAEVLHGDPPREVW